MSEPVEFTSGDHTVRGRFFGAAVEPPIATVLLLPGFPGNEDDVLGLGARLANLGVQSLMFNYRGTFESEGTYSLAHTVEDIDAAFEFLARPEVRERFGIGPEPVVPVGYSYGGGMALAYVAAHPEIRRVCSIAGTDHGEFMREYRRNAAFAEMIDTSFQELGAPAGPVRFAEERGVAELERNADPYDLRRVAGSLTDRDVLIIGAWDDPYVTIEAHVLPVYRKLVAAGSSSVRLRAFQDGHAFEQSAEPLAAEVFAWISAE